ARQRQPSVRRRKRRRPRHAGQPRLGRTVQVRVEQRDLPSRLAAERGEVEGERALADAPLAGPDRDQVPHAGQVGRDAPLQVEDLLENVRAAVPGDVVVTLHAREPDLREAIAYIEIRPAGRWPPCEGSAPPARTRAAAGSRPKALPEARAERSSPPDAAAGGAPAADPGAPAGPPLLHPGDAGCAPPPPRRGLYKGWRRRGAPRRPGPLPAADPRAPGGSARHAPRRGQGSRRRAAGWPAAPRP